MRLTLRLRRKSSASRSASRRASGRVRRPFRKGFKGLRDVLREGLQRASERAGDPSGRALMPFEKCFSKGKVPLRPFTRRWVGAFQKYDNVGLKREPAGPGKNVNPSLRPDTRTTVAVVLRTVLQKGRNVALERANPRKGRFRKEIGRREAQGGRGAAGAR